ncbi:MAG: AraC family transcriptional regulator [Novosphingobium sp.]
MPTEGLQPGMESRQLSDLLSGLELGGATWCYCDLSADGGFSVPHGDAALFHLVLHGTVRIALSAGEALELKAGEAVAVLGGDAHALRVAPGSAAGTLDFLRREQAVDAPPTLVLGSPGPVAARILSGRLSITLPSGASRSSLPGLFRLANAGFSAWGHLLKPEAMALAGIGPGSAALLTRVASLMIVAQLRADPRCRQMFAPEQRDPIGQALRLIAGNPSANWTVERLARSVGMGRSNFAAHFTTQVGRAPMEVVAEQRMEHAAQLLRKSKLKVAEISELSGYGSEAAFSRRFTRNFGMSPSALRDLARAAEAAQPADPLRGVLLAGPRQKDAAALRRTSPVKAEDSRPPRPAATSGQTTIFRARAE